MDAAENELLTRIGPGTPMGNLLRRYWLPLAGASEFDSKPIKPVRLLGEDLVLYKDLGGNFGLVQRACTHRRADLSYGFVEERGLRCGYHGWAYDETGQCIAMPWAAPPNTLAASSAVVLSPSRATRALNAGEWLRRGLRIGSAPPLANVQLSNPLSPVSEMTE